MLKVELNTLDFAFLWFIAGLGLVLYCFKDWWEMISGVYIASQCCIFMVEDEDLCHISISLDTFLKPKEKLTFIREQTNHFRISLYLLVQFCSLRIMLVDLTYIQPPFVKCRGYLKEFWYFLSAAFSSFWIFMQIYHLKNFVTFSFNMIECIS